MPDELRGIDVWRAFIAALICTEAELLNQAAHEVVYDQSIQLTLLTGPVLEVSGLTANNSGSHRTGVGMALINSFSCSGLGSAMVFLKELLTR